MKLDEEMIQSLAADSANDGSEADWRWFVSMLPTALAWIASNWGDHVVWTWKIRLLFLRKDIVLRVAKLCNLLAWVVETFAGSDPDPLGEETVS